jgi:hypothetical protein
MTANWFKKAKQVESKDKEMYDWFEKRTNKHIDSVRKYCKKIADYDNDRFKGIIERGKIHDDSKFNASEYEPYVYTTWKYKCEKDGKEFEAPEEMEDKMYEATEHHVKNNKHHPESHSSQKEVINKNDRDKPPENAVDASKMSELDIAEMCADWMAVSEERGTSPKTWADDNIGKRWKFTNEHEDLIYELIKEIF